MRIVPWIVAFASIQPIVASGAVPAGQSSSVTTAKALVPRIEDPPALEDLLDAATLSERTRTMAKLEGFIQRAPDDGQPATQRTEVYLGYTQRDLYILFVAHDSEPAKIRARLGARESFTLDEDQVGIYLDTFNDKRWAYQFACNALGVQDDSIYTEDSGTWDESFDTVWESRGIRTPDGFVVLMIIPFKSLRFGPASSLEWGIAVWRWLPRRAEGSWWPRVSQSTRGFLSQEATAAGFQQISPGRNVQFTPYANWRAFHAIDPAAPGGPAFVGSAADVKAGVDAKIVLQDRAVVDIAANPDFAQVESDEPQTTVNRRFEVYFPERRPFFTENAGYFAAPMADDNRLLFTRRIADPKMGVRLTGKIDRYSIGALFADDRAAGSSLPGDDPRRFESARFSAFRLSRDLPGQSNVGGMFVERQFAGSSNRVVDADAQWRMGRTWAMTVLAANSWTQTSDGAAKSRSDIEAKLNRQARGFNYNLQFVSMARGFNVEPGFIFRSDNRYVTQDSSYTFWPDGPVTKIKGRVYVEKGWFFHGGDQYATLAPSLSVELNHQTTVEVYSVQWHDVLRPSDYPALVEARSFPQMSYGVTGSSSQLRWLRLDLRYEAGKRLHYVPPEGEAPRPADFIRSQIDLSIKPNGTIVVANTYLFERNADPVTGDRMFTSEILRTKLNWQFSRALSLRLIGQYDAVRSNPFFTSTQTKRRFNADVLVTYLLHPGTALYVGYNTDVARPTIGDPFGDRFVNDGRQFFVKASYLIRL